MSKLTHRIVQGESYYYDFTSTDISDFTGYAGTWSIKDTLGGTEQSGGSLAISTDKSAMEMRIIDTDTNVLLGNYILIVEITNSTTNFNKEAMQDKLVISIQGIT